MRIIDAHAHLTKKELHGRGRKEQLLAEMERAGVETTFLMGESQPNEMWYSTAAILEEVEGIPELKVLAGIDVDGDIAAQAKTYEESLKNGTIIGFKLYPGYQYFYPADQRLEPIYALAKQHNVPVVIHTGDLFTQDASKPPLLKYSHPLNVDEAAALHPDVTFVIAHLGSPWFLDATEVVFKNPNVYADLSGFFQGTIGQGNDQAYVALVRQRLRESIAYLGDAAKFLYGTDWPLVTEAEAIAFFETVIPEEDRETFFHGNAERLFHL